MLVHELFPELADQVRRDLRKLKRIDLAEQVMQLRIVDRCRCGSEACGMFYTEGVEFRRQNTKQRADLMLQSGASISEAHRKIVEIETLDPQVERALRRIIP